MNPNVVLMLTYAPHPLRAAGVPDAPAAPELPASTTPTVAADGRVLGVDGLLDQISGSVARQFREELWPEIRSDRELQRTVGYAVGHGAGRELRPAATVAAAALSVGALALVVHAVRQWDR
jgi:hypothetical protein